MIVHSLVDACSDELNYASVRKNIDIFTAFPIPIVMLANEIYYQVLNS